MLCCAVGDVRTCSVFVFIVGMLFEGVKEGVNVLVDVYACPGVCVVEFERIGRTCVSSSVASGDSVSFLSVVRASCVLCDKSSLVGVSGRSVEIVIFGMGKVGGLGVDAVSPWLVEFSGSER